MQGEAGSGVGLNNGTWYGGKNVGWKLAADAMGISWMNRDELTQAIPPVFTEHIGVQLLMLLAHLSSAALECPHGRPTEAAPAGAH